MVRALDDEALARLAKNLWSECRRHTPGPAAHAWARLARLSPEAHAVARELLARGLVELPPKRVHIVDRGPAA